MSGSSALDRSQSTPPADASSTEVPSAAQAFALGVDPDDVAQLERVGPQELVHEVGADVPGPDDGSSWARAHGVDPHNRAGRAHPAVPESGTATAPGQASGLGIRRPR